MSFGTVSNIVPNDTSLKINNLLARFGRACYTFNVRVKALTREVFMFLKYFVIAWVALFVIVGLFA